MSGLESQLVLVGCGKMGGALLRGIAAQKLFAKIYVVEPSAPASLLNLPGVVWLSEWAAGDHGLKPDVVLYAVKPQVMGGVLPAYGTLNDALHISIAAGVTLARLAAMLGNDKAAIVRSMPNLPASIGQGATVAVANVAVSEQKKQLAQKCLEAAGTVVWLDDEKLLDAVTALSGSGPAYVFALCEMMAKVGQEMGLASDMAALLARQTLIGSGALLAASPESAEALRHAVTSPKGTTEAALGQLLSADGLHDLMRRTMRAAAQRSKELASS